MHFWFEGVIIIIADKKICNSCTGNYFVCTGCGTIYEQDDYKNGDNGTGYCRKNCNEK